MILYIILHVYIDSDHDWMIFYLGLGHAWYIVARMITTNRKITNNTIHIVYLHHEPSLYNQCKRHFQHFLWLNDGKRCGLLFGSPISMILQIKSWNFSFYDFIIMATIYFAIIDILITAKELLIKASHLTIHCIETIRNKIQKRNNCIHSFIIWIEQKYREHQCSSL